MRIYFHNTLLMNIFGNKYLARYKINIQPGVFWNNGNSYRFQMRERTLRILLRKGISSWSFNILDVHLLPFNSELNNLTQFQLWAIQRRNLLIPMTWLCSRSSFSLITKRHVSKIQLNQLNFHSAFNKLGSHVLFRINSFLYRSFSVYFPRSGTSKIMRVERTEAKQTMSFGFYSFLGHWRIEFPPNKKLTTITSSLLFYLIDW